MRVTSTASPRRARWSAVGRSTTLLVFVALALASCRSTDPIFLDEAGNPIHKLRPAMYRIAIAPVDERDVQLLGSARREQPLRFAFSAAEFPDEIRKAMNDLNAATSVHVVTNEEPGGIRSADLLIEPHVLWPPQIRHVGTSERVWLSAFLWITTWFGGLSVEDATYETRTTIEFRIKDPYNGLLIYSISARSATVDLTFWDRNPAVSWNTVQSFFLPPFWTSDHANETRRALSRVICRRMAAHLTLFLKKEMEQRLSGQVSIDPPNQNGAEVGPEAKLRGWITASRPITEVEVYCRPMGAAGSPQKENSPQEENKVEPVRPAHNIDGGHSHSHQLEYDIKLALGASQIAIGFRVGGRQASRTLVLYNGKGEGARSQ